MVTSTRQGSVPFAPFAGVGDTLDHYDTTHNAVGVVWVNISDGMMPNFSFRSDVQPKNRD